MLYALNILIKKILSKFPLAFLTLGVVLRLYFYWNKPIVADELWTYYWVKNNFLTIVTNSFADFRPPLYYLIIKYWQSFFNDSLESIRIFSLICSILFLVVIFFLAKTWANYKIALWALFLSAFAGGYIADASYGRMYAFVILLVSLVIWSIVLYIKTAKSRYLLFYGIVIILAIYTHFYLILLLISSVLFVFLHKKISKHFVLVHIAIFISLIPLLIFLISSVGHLQSFHPFISDNIFKSTFFLISAFFPSDILFLGVEMPNIQKYNYLFIFSLSIFLTGIFFQHCKRNFSTDGWFVLCFSLVPVGLITLFARFYKSILGIHPLIFFSIPLILILASIIYNRFWVRIIIVTIVVLSTIYYSLHLPLMRTDTQPFLYIKAHTTSNDLVLVQDLHSLLWLRYHNDILAKAIIPTQYDREVEKTLSYELIPFRSITEKRVFLIENTLYSGKKESRSLLKTHGYRMTNSSRFKELTVAEFVKEE